MKLIFLTVGLVVPCGFLLACHQPSSNTITPIIQGGFTDSGIRHCEQMIRDHYLKQLRNSSSATTERQEVENGRTVTVEAQMNKVADRRLEGFVKISMNAQEPRGGVSEITPCEATMEMNSTRYIWKCGDNSQPGYQESPTTPCSSTSEIY